MSDQSNAYCYWGWTFALGGGICAIPVIQPSRFPNSYVMYEPDTAINFLPVYPDRAYNEIAGLTLAIYNPVERMCELEPNVAHARACSPILGGLIWKLFGYEYVFLAAGGVALLTAITAYRIPQSVTAGPSPAGVSCPVWPVNGHAVAPTVGNPLDERSDL